MSKYLVNRKNNKIFNGVIPRYEKARIYSNEEQVIGKYKNSNDVEVNVYKKVIETTTSSSVSSWKTLTSGLNADEIFSYAGNIKYSQNETKLLPFSTGNSAIYFQKNETTNELQEAHTEAGLNSKNMKIVIEYTKNN